MEFSRHIFSNAAAWARRVSVAAWNEVVTSAGLLALDSLTACEAGTVLADLAGSTCVSAAAAVRRIGVDVHALSIAKPACRCTSKSVCFSNVDGRTTNDVFPCCWELTSSLVCDSQEQLYKMRG